MCHGSAAKLKRAYEIITLIRACLLVPYKLPWRSAGVIHTSPARLKPLMLADLRETPHSSDKVRPLPAANLLREPAVRGFISSVLAPDASLEHAGIPSELVTLMAELIKKSLGQAGHHTTLL